jgi:hypothetical protein
MALQGAPKVCQSSRLSWTGAGGFGTACGGSSGPARKEKAECLCPRIPSTTNFITLTKAVRGRATGQITVTCTTAPQDDRPTAARMWLWQGCSRINIGTNKLFPFERLKVSHALFVLLSCRLTQSEPIRFSDTRNSSYLGDAAHLLPENR